MNAYRLPTSLSVGGKEYRIATDFRVVLDILIAASDPDMAPWEKQEVMYQILYPDYMEIPPGDYEEACRKAAEFIDCGAGADERKPKPRVIDWEQDASLIIPAVNKVAGKEVRAAEYIHWWTFLGYFMEVGDGLFSQVLSIRQKKSRHRKLEKWEKEFEREHPELVNLSRTYSEEQKREMESMEKWL